MLTILLQISSFSGWPFLDPESSSIRNHDVYSFRRHPCSSLFSKPVPPRCLPCRRRYEWGKGLSAPHLGGRHAIAAVQFHAAFHVSGLLLEPLSLAAYHW